MSVIRSHRRAKARACAAPLARTRRAGGRQLRRCPRECRDAGIRGKQCRSWHKQNRPPWYRRRAHLRVCQPTRRRREMRYPPGRQPGSVGWHRRRARPVVLWRCGVLRPGGLKSRRWAAHHDAASGNAGICCRRRPFYWPWLPMPDHSAPLEHAGTCTRHRRDLGMMSVIAQELGYTRTEDALGGPPA